MSPDVAGLSFGEAAMVLMLLSLMSAAMAEPGASEDDEVTGEVIVVVEAARARRDLHDHLLDMGYTRARRRGDKVVYRSRDRWRPKVVVYDDGFMVLRDSPLVPEAVMVVLAPSLLLLGVKGKIVSPRMLLGEEARVVAEVRPLVETWRTAMVAEGGEATAQEVAGPTAGDVARGAVGLAMGIDPWDLEPPGAATTEMLDAAQARGVATAGAGAAWIRPDIAEALLAVPRRAFVADEQAERAAKGGPVGGPVGIVLPSVSVVALQLRLARVGAGDRVLELGLSGGYRAALCAAMGAAVWEVAAPSSGPEVTEQPPADQEIEVHRVAADPAEGLLDHAPFDVIFVEAVLLGSNGSDPLAAQLSADGVLLVLDGSVIEVVRWGSEGLERKRFLTAI